MAKSFERTPLEASSDAWDDLAGAIVAEDYFDAAPAAATGLVKVFTAGGWVAHAVKVWTGTAWELAQVKRWTGTAWAGASSAR